MNETSSKRPNAALINKEWYESAKEVLTPEELGRALMNAIAYVLYGDELPPTKTNVGLVCRMIKPALDSDIERYQERCARNAANAKRGAERVGASGSEWQRVAANTTTIPNTTSTTTKISLSREEEKAEKERDLFVIGGYFWQSGSKAVPEELTAFWSYYESLGWKNGKGAAIVNKLAAARMWRRQYETGAVPDGAALWWRVCQQSKIYDSTLWRIFRGIERTENAAVVHLACKGSYLASMRQNMPFMEPALRAALKVEELKFSIL